MDEFPEFVDSFIGACSNCSRVTDVVSVGIVETIYLCLECLDLYGEAITAIDR